MNNCDECKVRKYCDDFFCLGGITCDETRDMIEQIRADAIEKCIDKFAEIMSNMHQICGRSCPVDCNWGAEGKCKDRCKKWLREQLKEQE